MFRGLGTMQDYKFGTQTSSQGLGLGGGGGLGTRGGLGAGLGGGGLGAGLGGGNMGISGTGTSTGMFNAGATTGGGSMFRIRGLGLGGTETSLGGGLGTGTSLEGGFGGGGGLRCGTGIFQAPSSSSGYKLGNLGGGGFGQSSGLGSEASIDSSMSTPLIGQSFKANTFGMSGGFGIGMGLGGSASGMGLRLNSAGMGGNTAGTPLPFVVVKGTDTMLKGDTSFGINTISHCCTAMKEYERKSLEELRYEDYEVGRKGKMAGVGMMGGTGMLNQTGGLSSNMGIGLGLGMGLGNQAMRWGVSEYRQRSELILKRNEGRIILRGKRRLKSTPHENEEPKIKGNELKETIQLGPDGDPNEEREIRDHQSPSLQSRSNNPIILMSSLQLDKKSMESTPQSSDVPHKYEGSDTPGYHIGTGALRDKCDRLANEVIQLKSTLEMKEKKLSKQAQKSDIMEKSWRINNKDIQVTSTESLGKGGWGTVVVGVYREQKVAVKQLHNMIKSDHNLAIMNREISTMSRLRHPNLLLFIGAVLDHPSGNPLIVTEIMDTSLRQAYEKGELTNDEYSKLSILRDTASGLNYLHCHYDEIIHRDVSSANVLLESRRGTNKWRAKISDFGSANIARQAFTQQMGAAVYSAPETQVALGEQEQPQTTKMDVYSYGILSCEVLCCQFPQSHTVFRTMLTRVCNNSPSIGQMIRYCMKKSPQHRPTMAKVIHCLDDEIKSKK